MNIIAIGIAGGSGSGKSTLAENIAENFPEQTVILHQDNYYLPQDKLAPEDREKINYDKPDSMDNALFYEQINTLKNGKTVHCPVYDFAVHTRKKQTVLLLPAPILIAEGMLVLQNDMLRALFDLKIFIDVTEQQRLRRRIERDVSERSRTEQAVRAQFAATVKPAHDRYVQPSARYADIIVSGGGKNPLAQEQISRSIRQLIKRKELSCPSHM